MKKNKTKHKQITLRLTSEIKERLESQAQEMGLSISAAVMLALFMYQRQNG